MKTRGRSSSSCASNGTQKSNGDFTSDTPKKSRKIRKSSSQSPSRKPKQIQSNLVQQRDTNVVDIEYEFGGPMGALGVVLGLPAVIYFLYFVCNKELCVTNPMSFDWEAAWDRVPCCYKGFFSTEATLIFSGWMLFQILLERVLPGEVVEGTLLPNKTRLKYRLSGHLQWWVTALVLTHGWIEFSPLGELVQEGYKILKFTAFPLSLVYDHYLGLISASVLFSFLLSVFLYVYSFMQDPNGIEKILAKGGNTGDIIYDFFIGRELNPRIGTFDLKEFCELRPGLIGWAVINLGMAFKQFEVHGSVSMSMVLLNIFQGIYVWDALHAERAILTTMDITTDGFGYMLAFGDLAWVPFIYTLQARYLVDYDPGLSMVHILAITVIHFLGYFIFRSANSQKDAFRRNPLSPEVSHLSFMETKRGTRLITSGWWGAARKINYTGDWLITFSWCLLCGYDSPVPYFHAAYFLILLVHRTMRDDQMCVEKYGADWEEYKRRVPHIFIPGVV